MTKQKLLKEVHKLIWRNDDLMSQDELFELQEMIDKEILEEAENGNLKVEQYENGYISKITIK